MNRNSVTVRHWHQHIRLLLTYPRFSDFEIKSFACLALCSVGFLCLRVDISTSKPDLLLHVTRPVT